MIIYERNIDIDEIETDATFGIEYLSHQTFTQKLTFWGSAILAGLIFFASSFGLIATDFKFLSNLATIALIAVGVLFGTNYNEFMPMWKFALLILFQREKKYTPETPEDIRYLRRQMEMSRKSSKPRTLTITMVTTIILTSLTACSFPHLGTASDLQNDLPTPVATIETLSDNMVYVKSKDTYYPAPVPEASFEIGYGRDESDDLDTLWLSEAESDIIPTLKKDDELIFISSTASRLDQITFEAFLDNGFSIGLANLQADDGGHIFIPIKEQKRGRGSFISLKADTVSIMEAAHDYDLVYLDKIGSAPVKKDLLTPGGAISGLTRGKSYLAEFYLGTTSWDLTLKADRRVFSYKDFTTSTQYTFLHSTAIRIDLPPDLLAGYYLINNTGLVKIEK